MIGPFRFLRPEVTNRQFEDFVHETRYVTDPERSGVGNVWVRDGHLRTSPVGEFPSGASPFGILDMAGNVWEWTASEFPGRPGFVVLRGGGWGNDPYGLRASYRHANPPDIGLDMVGFRCAADPRDL